MDYNYIHDQLKSIGYVEIENFLDESTLSEIRKYVINEKKRLKTDNFSKANDELKNEVFLKIRNSENLMNLCKKIFTLNNISENFIKPEEIHMVLGVRNSQNTKQKNKIKFHFDAYLLTINIPITIPKFSTTDSAKIIGKGELLLLPNFRNFNQNIFMNIITKIIFQNPISRWILGYQIVQRKIGIKTINLSASNIYIFYGYRSLHGVNSYAENSERTTLLLHISNPHQNSFFDKYIKRRHKNQRINFKALN